jgi:hypothetical protein
MRLLKRHPNDTVSLTKNLVGDDIPDYAILSHTWRGDADEVTLKDIETSSGQSKIGYEKIEFCVNQAKQDGLEYFWIDTCCINQANSPEVSEAINSMFRWYRNATRCYVYLSDVLFSLKRKWNSEETDMQLAFRASKWFTRGWTLQELLAPSSVEFFARNGKRIGDKKGLGKQIHEITGIPISALQGADLSTFKVEERLKWAENRETTREEDRAYCLLGIFGVFMSPRYGEGKSREFNRLRAKINKASTYPSIVIPFSRDQDFVERGSMIDRIQNCNKLGFRTALVGLGGVG